jgi:hypothetical protein
MVLDAASRERSSRRSPSPLPRLRHPRDERQPGTTPSPGTRQQKSVLKISPDACRRAPSPYPDGTWARNGGAGPLIRRPVIRSRPGTTRVPRSTPSPAAQVSVASQYLRRLSLVSKIWRPQCGHAVGGGKKPSRFRQWGHFIFPMKICRSAPAAIKSPRGAFLQRRLLAAVVPRWPFAKGGRG